MNIIFSETKSFYQELDSVLKSKKSAVIVFKSQKPGEKSKLWPRLRKCKNWSNLEKDLYRIKEGKNSLLQGVISKQMKSYITGGEILLIGWIATLLTSLAFYGLYKGCGVKLRTTLDGEVELEISPTT